MSEDLRGKWRGLTTEDHNEIMSKIDKNMALHYERLANEFFIAQHDIMTITANASKVNTHWHGLNAVVDTWLRGNYSRYREVKPNVKWLVDAVTKIDNAFGEKLAKEYGITISSENPPEAKDKTEDHITVKTDDKGVEETDSGAHQSDLPTIKNPKIPEPPDDVSASCLEFAKIEEKIEERVKTFDELTEEEKKFLANIKCILLTANKKEYCAVMSVAIAKLGEKEKYTKIMSNDGSAKCVIVKYGQYNAAVMRTGQGAEPTRQQLTEIQKIIKAPYVIAVGICYGLQPDKSELGDIIIGKSIFDISHTQAKDKGTKFISKERYFGEYLHSLFTRQDTYKVTPKATVMIHHEPGDCLVTETTRVTDQKRKNDILAQIPQALGGEMEAAGIYAAKEGEHKFKEWIVVKAIADWGDEKKAECAPWKTFSAVAAAKYVEHQLNMYELK